MKLTKLLIALLISANCYSQNPLSLWDAVWDNPAFEICNTAKDANYMTRREKDVIWVLNCMRAYPSLFLKTVVVDWDYPKRYISCKEKNEYKNLIIFFKTLQPINILYPDSLVFVSAMTRAEEYPSHTGHFRTTKIGKNNECNCGEVISYNSFDPIDIVMDLMVDIENPDYGHRKNLTNNNYSKAGAVIRKSNPGFFVSIIDFR